MDSAYVVGSIIGALLWIVVVVVYIAAMWVIFRKAGQPGWASLIPFYNTYVLLKIVGRPGWWLILMLIPLVNLIVSIITLFDLSRSFGHGVGFALGLILLAPIFILILAFGSSQYVGPAASPASVRQSYG